SAAYCYARWNPVAYTDLTGLRPKILKDAAPSEPSGSESPSPEHNSPEPKQSQSSQDHAIDPADHPIELGGWQGDRVSRVSIDTREIPIAAVADLRSKEYGFEQQEKVPSPPPEAPKNRPEVGGSQRPGTLEVIDPPIEPSMGPLDLIGLGGAAVSAARFGWQL